MKQFILLFFVISCASFHEMKPVRYDKPATIQTQKKVSVELITGAVKAFASQQLIQAGNIYVPVSTGGDPRVMYGEKEQKLFAESLVSELNRLAIAKASAFSKAATDLNLRLFFAYTEHSKSSHRYQMRVALIFQRPKKPETYKLYDIDSEQDVSFVVRMNTNASDGKDRASKMLMDKIIPDIEAELRR